MKNRKGIFSVILALMLLFSGVSPASAATQSWKVVGGLHFSGSSTNDTNLALDSSGTPYVAYEDNSDYYMRIRVKKFNRANNNWDNVGDYIDSNGSSDLDLAIDRTDVPYVAYKNPSSQKACVVRFDGANWVAVGPLNFSAGAIDNISIATDSQGTPYVSYHDNTLARVVVMRFDGSSWAMVGGAAVSANPGRYTNLAFGDNDELFVEYQLVTNGNIMVHRLAEGAWSAVGATGAVGSSRDCGIAVDSSGNPCFIFSNAATSGSPSVRLWNGLVWTTLGTISGANSTDETSVVIDDNDTIYIAYTNNSGSAMVQKWNGTGWVTLGSGPVTGLAEQLSLALSNDGTLYLGIKNNDSGYDPAVYCYDYSYSLNYSAGAHGSITGVASQTVDRGGSGTEVEAVADTGYHFAQWSDGAQNAARTDSDVAADISVTAQFQVNSYTVHYNANGGAGIMVDDIPNYGDSFALTNGFTRSGYAFAGWATSEDGPIAYSDGETVQNLTAENGETVTLYAQWTKEEYAISYDLDGGTVDQANPTMYSVDSDAITLRNPTKAEYVFIGWSGTGITGLATTVTIPTGSTGDRSYTANWAASTCTVTFDSQGGTVVGPQTVQYNATVSAPADPARAGYVFQGWYKEPSCATAWSFETQVTADIALYAKWALEDYTIGYNLNGGTVSQANPTAYSVESDSITLHNPTRVGYVFAGWSGTGITGLASTVTVPTGSTGNRYYTANWTVATVTVTFNSQGGTAVSPKTAKYNTTITAPVSPTRSGYVFQGWYRQSSCTTAWNFAKDKVTANITLYAKWVSTIPAGVKAASASYTSIKVTWNAVPGVAGYKLYCATSSAGPWSPKATVTAPTYTCTGLVTGKYYYFKVRSYNAAKVYSAYSAVVYARPIPAAPCSVKAARASSTSIKVTWGKVSGATRYELWRSTSATGTYGLVSTTSSLYSTNSRLTKGRTYYYKVRCYHLEGRTKVYSAWSAVVSAKP